MKTLSIALVTALLLVATGTVANAQWLTADKADYAPGETATLTGTDFAPGEEVVLQVHHTGAVPDTGEDHQPWTVIADASGAFVTTWHVCEDDCIGQSLLATADGQSSGLHAEAAFMDSGPFSSAPLPELPVTNDAILAITKLGSTVYIGGDFTLVGPYTGGGIPVDASSGVPVAGFPKVNGMIHAVVPDGLGGWYIGGAFTNVGGITRNRVAQVDASNNVTAWNPNANNEVLTLAVSGGIVYAGGFFSGAASIGGANRNFIAALNPTTGLATGWNPNANGSVRVLAVSGSTVYAGGGFFNIGGQPRVWLAALDATTGLAAAWNPSPNAPITTLAVGGATVYVAGFFSTIGGASRNLLAALDATTGFATGWNPNPNSPVNAIVVSGSNVYVGGFFGFIGGQPRTGVAALDAATGLATSWNANATNPARSIAVAGGTVYVGGDTWAFIGGQPRTGVAAIDAVTGLATSWNPSANGTVRALAVSGSQVFVGGDLSCVGMVPRSQLAAFDATTGAIHPWNPSPNRRVASLVESGGNIIAGGEFTFVGGQPRFGIAALDPTTGLATAWNPGMGGAIQTLAVTGNTIYAGGSFTLIGGQARARIAALDATTGLATAWNPNANGFVQAVVVSGSRVYAAGLFTTIGGQPRNRMAALDVTSGLATAWNPAPNADVRALAAGASVIYAGGFFTSIGGAARNRLAALDATTGSATAWNPNPNSTVIALAVDGNTVYAGGGFTGSNSIGGATRDNLAALDVTTGLATAWNPDGDEIATALMLDASTIYAGGSFSHIGTSHRRGLAGFGSACTPPVIVFCPPNATVGCGGPTGPSNTGVAIASGTGVVLTFSDVFAASCGTAGAITRTWTATGTCGSATCVQTITVVDTQAPTIGAAGANATIACPASPVFTAPTASDGCDPNPQVVVVSDIAQGPCPGTYSRTVTWKARDCAGNESGTVSQTIHVVDTNAPVVSITGPPSGSVYAVGTVVNFSGSFTDACGNPHAATWTFDAATQPGVVTEGSPGTVTATRAFTAAGVYMVQLAVADNCNNTGTANQVGGADAMVVIYDPSAGFVTGGGWIDSPAGAYVADPLLEGRANFGFVSKYKKGASLPTGETEFRYQLGNLNFHSASYQWLVVAGHRAQYKGSGTINGAGSYDFILTAIDGQIAGDGEDKFRIKITDSGGGLVYDNKLDAPDSDDPSTVLGGGSIVIHAGGGSMAAMTGGARDEIGAGIGIAAAAPADYELAQNAPNPFAQGTRIAFGLPEPSRVSVVLYDVAGRAVRTLAEGDWEPGRHAAMLNRTAAGGGTLGAGVYFVQMNAQSLVSERSFRSLRKIVVVR